jgi:hypothetical protein
MSSIIYLSRFTVLFSRAMPPRKPSESKGGAWIFRDIPRDLMQRAKIVAAIEGKSIKGLILDLLHAKIQDMEKKGLLPKGK